MNYIISSIGFILIMVSAPVLAQDPAVTKRLADIKQKFDALSVDESSEYLDLKCKAYEDFKVRKYFTCMVAVSDARRIFQDHFDLIYFLATCSAHLRDFDTATEYYNQVLELNPQHIPSLISIIDINIYEGRYEEAIKKIDSLNKLINSLSATSSSLLDFKYLLCLTKLSSEHPGKYDESIKKMQGRYTYMDDDLFYYYATALKELAAGNKEEGLAWIMRAYLIFRNTALMEGWNTVLIDTGYLHAHEIMVDISSAKK